MFSVVEYMTSSKKIPFFISKRKRNKKTCYSLRSRRGKRIFSKCTSLTNAKKQRRLLSAILFNKTFRRR